MEKLKNRNRLVVYVKNTGKFVPNGATLDPKQGRSVFKTTYSFNELDSVDSAYALMGMLEDENLRLSKAYYNHQPIKIPDKNEEINEG